MRAIRCLLLLIVNTLWLIGSPSAQEAPDIEVLSIGGFGGLNTVDVRPPSKVIEEPGNKPRIIVGATIAHETDLSRGKVGTISKRYGFDMIDSLTDVDGIVLLEALQFNDGSKYMMVIGKDPDSGWGRIYVSNEGSDNFEQDSLTEIYSRLAITGTLSLDKLRDRFYVTSSTGGGVIIGHNADGFFVHQFPVLAPGEPLIVPFDTIGDATHGSPDTTYVLNGTYRYLFYLRRSTASGQEADPSILSSEVKVNNGRIYMTHFDWMPMDSGIQHDSTTITMYRTHGDHGALDASDSVFYWGTSVIRAGSASDLASVVFIDSIPDANLVGAGFAIMAEQGHLTGFNEYADTSGGSPFERRYGAPGYWGRTAWAAADTAADGSVDGVYGGWPTPESMILSQGVSYACTYLDTLVGNESRLGEACVITRAQDDTALSYTLSLPRPSENLDDIGINLYRAAVRVVYNTVEECGVATWTIGGGGGFDKNIVVFSKRITRNWCGDELITLIGQYGEPDYITIAGQPSVMGSYLWRFQATNWRDIVTTDTVYVEQYRLVEQLTDTATVYTDTLRYDSLATHRPYQENFVPPFLKSTFAYNGRLYGVDGNNLYRSDAADPDSWGIFDFVEVNPGFDELTGVWAGQFAIRAVKALSNYNVDWGSFVEPEIVGRWGCVAPKSVALSPAGPIYLSDGGVVLEQDGQFLERTIVPGIISNTLNNFNDMDPIERKAAVGEWLPREQQYWICVEDTTYIWDWQATKRLGENTWTTSSVTFAGGTFYDTDDEYAVVPGRSFYFWREGDNRIFRYGQGITYEEKDYNVSSPGTYAGIQIKYKTGPLLWDIENSQVRGAGLLINFEGTAAADSNAVIILYPYDETDASTGTYIYQEPWTRFMKYESPASPALYYQLYLTTDGLYPLTSGTSIEALDVYYIRNAARIPFNQ